LKRGMAVTYEKALALDTKGSFYADLDEDSGFWGVFGTESGFCYRLVSDESAAKVEAEKLSADGSEPRHSSQSRHGQ